MSLEECKVLLSSKNTNFFSVDLLSLTIHDLKFLLHCAVFIGFILFFFNAIDFGGARVDYDRLYFYQSNKKKIMW